MKGGWNIADCVARSYDVEGMNVRHCRRRPHRPARAAPAQAFRHETALPRSPPPAESVEKELNLTHHTSLESLTRVCDVVTLNCPLHPETERMINAKTLANFKRGAYLINTARGKLWRHQPTSPRR